MVIFWLVKEAVQKASLINRITAGFSEFIFPEACAVCGRSIPAGTRFVCVRCRATMTTLDLHHLPENTITDRFWGRLPVDRAAALLPYSQGTPAQRLMWLLKYDNRPEVGVKLGAWLGQLIKHSFVFGEVDYVIPVPLHEKKLRTRGYNQAERVAAGIAEEIDAECLPFAVVRKQFTETQTRKSQFERMENVEAVFELARSPNSQGQTNQKSHFLTGKHILLVDDVMTTGATLEALGRAILPARPASFKVAVLALARF